MGTTSPAAACRVQVVEIARGQSILASFERAVHGLAALQRRSLGLAHAGFLRGRPAQRRAARPAAHHLASRCSAILVAAAIRSPRPYGIWHVGRVLIHHGPAYRAPWCVAHIRWPPFTIPRTRNARLHGDAGVGLFAAWLREAERYVQSATSIPQASRARGRSARFGGIGPE